MLTLIKTGSYAVKDTKLYVPLITLSVKCNQKLSKLLAKNYNEYRTKSESKYQTNENRYQIFAGVKWLFVLVYL